MTQALTLVWFRRDLRTFDHSALQTAIRQGRPLAAVFLFDRDIMDSLPADDRRLSFIHQCLSELHGKLAELKIPLYFRHGRADSEIPALAAELNAAAVVCAEDYEPQAIARDTRVAAKLINANIEFQALTDQVMLAKSAVMTQQDRPYQVFTPYYKAWLAIVAEQYAGWQSRDDWATLQQLQQKLPNNLPASPPPPSLSELGFTTQTLVQNGGETAAQAALGDFLDILADYPLNRDFPAKRGTSQLSAHLRFGTLSIRHLVYLAKQADNEGGALWLKELAWREFFQQLFYHYPQVAEQAFRAEYRHLAWQNHSEWLERWQNGQTGYPIIDAAMRALKQTGQMHNRLRMITASFLCKDLLIDWRLGQDWFAAQLLDFDLAANNGNWQWAAGTGCDAQPYFRIFNPITQSYKFDPEGRFLRRFLPEIAHLDNTLIHAPWRAGSDIDCHGYPPPIVDHAVQREQAMALFSAARTG